MAQRLFSRLAELERQGTPVALCTVVRATGSVPRHAGSKMIVFADGSIEVDRRRRNGRPRHLRAQSLASGETQLVSFNLSDPSLGDPGVCGGEVEVFVEPSGTRPTLVVFGGGHVGKAVVHLAHWLGFRTAVADDRAEFASPQAVPDADEYVTCALSELPQRLTIDARTYLVLTTRGVPVDVEGLPALLDTSAAYIGVIGSRRRWETAAAELEAKGVPRGKLERVTSPMGLELNAETPEEIAVSILAEIIRLRRGGSGEPMAHQPRPKRESRSG
jgi:xanthine dehydrogenase accessory factor